MTLRIVLDPTLKRLEPRRPYEVIPASFGANLVPSPDWRKREKPSHVFLHSDLAKDTERLHLGFVGLVSEAYNLHEKLRVAPHDLWFVVLTELAKVINANSETCRPLFTTSAEVQPIVVETRNPTDISPEALLTQLRQRVPTNVDAFLPHLSTADQAVNVAMAATFADAVQSYYSYSTFMCGIPEIEVTGTFEDWKRCVDSIRELANLFLSVGLNDAVQYLIRVGDVFAKIAFEVAEDYGVSTDVSFFKGIFRSRNVGSGGELYIDGWITNLFFTKHPVPKLENFTSTYGSFPYTNLETKRKFRATHGAFSQRRSADGFIYAGYGSVTHEVMVD